MPGKKLSRRTFLAATAATGYSAAATAQRKKRSQKNDQPKELRWTNWSGSVTTHPAQMETPKTEESLVKLVQSANKNGQSVRVTGSGHSFMPLCRADDGLLINLSSLRGIESLDTDRLEATIWGGTKIFQMGKPLREAGMAMENMADVDVQAIAGAIATSTHGTGPTLGSLSTQVVGIRLVTASGEVVECSAEKDPEIFKAAQVSLGALGVVTQVRMRMLPTYRLHEKIQRIPFNECFAKMPNFIEDYRHFEFFWMPKMDVCFIKTLEMTDVPFSQIPEGKNERIGHSDKIFPSARSRKFNEIEFSLPEAQGPDCLQELRTLLLEKHPTVTMPLEYRTLAEDDIYLSMAYGRPTVTISAHNVAAEDYNLFFRDVEAIFRNHQGRPHWGKINYHTGEELAAMYPKWDAFQKVRKELDPKNQFLNAYLKRIFT